MPRSRTRPARITPQNCQPEATSAALRATLPTTTILRANESSVHNKTPRSGRPRVWDAGRWYMGGGSPGLATFGCAPMILAAPHLMLMPARLPLRPLVDQAVGLVLVLLVGVLMVLGCEGLGLGGAGLVWLVMGSRGRGGRARGSCRFWWPAMGLVD